MKREYREHRKGLNDDIFGYFSKSLVETENFRPVRAMLLNFCTIAVVVESS
jgi:hypothetical protein